MSELVGQFLGNYQLLRLLGRGAFAEVYLAEHRYLEVPAAIKVLHVRMESDTHEHFLLEARTIAHLQHRHIIRVLDFGFQEQTPFLVMEYTPNGTLRTRHPKGTRVPLEQIIHYVKQIAPALDYAHLQLGEDIKSMQQPHPADIRKAMDYYNRGASLLNRGRYEEALTALNKAIALDPSNLETYYDIGGCLANLGRCEEALAVLNKAIALDPSDTRAYFNRGLCLEVLKRYEEALAAYNKAITLNPNDPRANRDKGVVLASLRRYEEALTALNKAIALDPSDAYAYYNRGAALANLGRHKEALAAFEQARRLNPNLATQ